IVDEIKEIVAGYHEGQVIAKLGGYLTIQIKGENRRLVVIFSRSHKCPVPRFREQGGDVKARAEIDIDGPAKAEDYAPQHRIGRAFIGTVENDQRRIVPSHNDASPQYS